MPPTPQQSHSYTTHQHRTAHHHQQQHQHMAPQASPQQSASSQPNGVPGYGGHGYNMSFDGAQQSLSQPASGYSQSFPNGPVSNPGFARSFGDQANMSPMRSYSDKPQIYTAVYSGVSVYEMEIGGVACMRRRSDGWLNATQILKVAGVDKGKRTKVLEKEILTGEHEKVQGGYGKYQGTWISYRRGREFCRQYGVEDVLRPLLEYDINADGSSGQSQQETPTKEQAMAAQRKKFYNNPGLDQRPNGLPNSNGTFFSNISPTTSVALAAMNKAARLNSPAPRTGSTPRPSNMRQSSQQDAIGSQQSAASDAKGADSGYNTQHTGEPPRKRMRPDSQDGMGPPNIPLDVSMRSATPTEPNESFLYENALMQESVNGAGEPIALPPLPSPTTEDQQEKMNLILDLFAEQGRTDYASHRALTDLSHEDLNMPLDATANNALHWAATLGKVTLLKLLIQKGASIWRGNAAGQSPLISAVLVNNCWEHSCFPEVLELLGPLIEVRDLQGRTILHHIAVSSGIKGRGLSSKYYLEALLEFLVRIRNQPNASVASVQAAAAELPRESQQSSGESSSQDSAGPLRGPLTLPRFLSHIVNARDKVGNTALNLVARIGNRSIISQLLEIHADPSIANNKGVSAKDFGVGVEQGDRHHLNGSSASQQSQSGHPSYPMPNAGTPDGEAPDGGLSSQADDIGQDIIASMTSMVTQNLALHKEHLDSRSGEIDRLNGEIRELSSVQKTQHETNQATRERMRIRSERRAKVANLRREIEQKKASVKRLQGRKTNNTSSTNELIPDWLRNSSEAVNIQSSDGQPTPHQREILSNLPNPRVLQARLNAYSRSNGDLQHQAEQLKSKSMELEGMYRKVVSLCTNVPEDKVEESLPALVAAVESERGSIGEQEVGRVREFLRRVDTSKDQQPSFEGGLMVNPTITAAAERAAAERAARGQAA